MDFLIFEGPTKKGLELIKYYLRQIGISGLDWTWWYYQFTNHILSLFYKRKNDGIYIMDRIWDHLIILDACRYDVFRYKFEREKDFFKNYSYSLEKVYSRGSSTPEFLVENFSGRCLRDVIYVAANPYVYTLLPRNTFFKVVHVWRTHWDEKLGVVHPEAVAKKALEVHSEYPNKKLIIHFMQPHSPYIGKYRKRESFISIALKEGLDEAMKAYLSNLDLVFPYVKLLIEKLDGIIVVTSDHGEAWGERACYLFPIYGHPKYIKIPSLREVPWLTIYKEHIYEHLEREKLKRTVERVKYRVKRALRASSLFCRL